MTDHNRPDATCEDCLVYKVKSINCYALRKEVGHQAICCRHSCEDCAYFPPPWSAYVRLLSVKRRNILKWRLIHLYQGFFQRGSFYADSRLRNPLSINKSQSKTWPPSGCLLIRAISWMDIHAHLWYCLTGWLFLVIFEFEGIFICHGLPFFIVQRVGLAPFWNQGAFFDPCLRYRSG